MAVIEDSVERSRLAAQISRDNARADLNTGLSHWATWVSLAWWDTRARYKRTFLGPLWITISMAVMVLGLGLLYTQIFKTSAQDYLPYLASGLIVWGLVAGFFTEAPGVLVGASGVITQMNVPYTTHIGRALTRQLIIFLHNVIVLVGVNIYGQVPLTWATLLVVPGLVLVMLSGAWITLILSLIGARYRDLGPIIGSILQLLFFLTPIIWQRTTISAEAQRIWVDGNPLYHLIEIIRAPMLGVAPPMASYQVAIGITIVGLAASYLVFVSYRRRVAYWL